LLPLHTLHLHCFPHGLRQRPNLWVLLALLLLPLLPPQRYQLIATASASPAGFQHAPAPRPASFHLLLLLLQHRIPLIAAACAGPASSSTSPAPEVQSVGAPSTCSSLRCWDFH
jgi:hypothetical protein